MAEAADENISPASVRRPGVGFLLAVLAALALLIGLGVWQLHRLEWKEDLLAAIERRVAQPPVSLDEALVLWRTSGDVDYLPVRLNGIYRHDHEQHFLATLNGHSGWHVYTPMQLANGRLVIVNRGFVPYDLKDMSARPWRPVSGAVGINGLARNPLTEKPGWLLPENAPADRIWYWKDFAGMAEAMTLAPEPLVPFFVDVSDTDAAEGPVSGVTRVSLPNNHLQYAVTWFGLAAVLTVTAALLVWRGRGRTKS